MPTSSVTLDKKAIQTELYGRNGAVGRVLAGFAGLVTQEINQTFQARAGGKWWPVRSSISGDVNPELIVEVAATKPHVIIAKNARVLSFEVNGIQVFTQRVSHPGSSPPAHLITQAMTAAGAKFSVLAQSVAD